MRTTQIRDEIDIDDDRHWAVGVECAKKRKFAICEFEAPFCEQIARSGRLEHTGPTTDRIYGRELQDGKGQEQNERR